MLKQAKGASVALSETFLMALDTLRAHKLRSFLTLLGVILAVTTLVAVMSVIEGLNVYITDRVANLGASAFEIDRFGILTSREAFVRALRRPPLRVEDYEALVGRMQLAQRLSVFNGTSVDARYGSQTLEDVSLNGVSANYADIRNLNVENGRFLTDVDDLHRSPVCFIGADVSHKFFPAVDPIGKTIRTGAQSYMVVGVARALGTVFGQSQDNFILIPFGSYQKAWAGPLDSIRIFVQARSAEVVDAAQDEARLLLRARRHVSYNEPDNFGFVATSSITSLWEQLTGNIFTLAVWLTSVFLVVGGIVIMNIMMASVTERTREIGLRKSLGARRRHIVMQFMVESAVLAAAGGLIGILLALGISATVRALTPMPITTPLRAVVIALTLSTSVGLFFGIYPAVRASRLDPIEALRAEG